MYCAIIVALVKPLGWYMTRVFNGERTFLSPVLRPVEAALYWIGGVDEKREQSLGDLHDRHAVLPCRRVSHPLRADAHPGDAAVQPGGAIRGRVGPLLQYGGELHHQHQLAELRRREHAVLSRADARPDAPELPVGGDRHRARCGADPRLCARIDEDHRQFLGRCHPLHALHPAADLHRLRALPRLAGHAADARPLCRGDDAGRRQADHRGRPGRLADRDQDARHQRRRLLQRQRRPSVREPDGAVELRADHLDLRDRRRADQRVRPHGRQPAPGLGHPRRHGRAVHRRRHRLLLGGSARQRCADRDGPHRRQHGRQGSPFRHRRLRAVRRHHHRRLVRRRQRHARLVHRARRHDPADQHRSSARSSSAASAPACTACCSSSSWRSSSPA